MIDFLIYYLTYWFTKNKKKLVWSTPIERAIYAIVLAIAGVCAFVYVIIEKTSQKEILLISKLLIVVVAIGINLLLRYIYIKQGRYEKIVAKEFSLNTRAGVIISMTIIAFCTVGWLICYMIMVPPGSGK